MANVIEKIAEKNKMIFVCLQKNEIRRSDADEEAPTVAVAKVENEDKNMPSDVITSYAGDADFAQRKRDYFGFDDSLDATVVTTTESNDDYFSHDNESVDRLALDGELKSPLDDFDPFNF